MITEYRVVIAETLEEFLLKVNGCIDAGFKPHGDMQIIRFTSDIPDGLGTLHFVQPMVHGD